MKLYVIRHGESETNLSGCYTGHLQVPLTEKGIKEAESVHPFLSGINFDKIYSSDLIRAKRTAEAAIPGCVYEETPLLREVDLGELSGKNIIKISIIKPRINICAADSELNTLCNRLKKKLF